MKRMIRAARAAAIVWLVNRHAPELGWVRRGLPYVPVPAPSAWPPHGVVADVNGEPVCKCGWNPVHLNHVHSRADAVSAIRRHQDKMN